MRKNRRFKVLLVALAAGVAPFVGTPAYADKKDDKKNEDKNEKVSICWRGHTISVPRHTYEKTFAPRGATLGPCEVTPT